jgi:hypothetical protein
MRVTNQQYERLVLVEPLAVPVVLGDVLAADAFGNLLSNGMATNGGNHLSAVIAESSAFPTGLAHVYVSVLQANTTWVTLAVDYGPVAAGGSVTIDLDISCNRVRILACTSVLLQATTVLVGATIKSV